MAKSCNSAQNTSLSSQVTMPGKARLRSFSLPETPIPRRASAHPGLFLPRSRYTPISPVARPDYDVSDLPTIPPQRSTRLLEDFARTSQHHLLSRHIDEITTQPPVQHPVNEETLLSPATILPDIPTIPIQCQLPEKAVSQPLPPALPEEIRTDMVFLHPLHPISLLDNVRWWLVHPGRIEILCWIGGTLLLICLTSIFIGAIIAHAQEIRPADQITAPPSPTMKESSPLCPVETRCSVTPASSPTPTATPSPTPALTPSPADAWPNPGTEYTDPTQPVQVVPVPTSPSQVPDDSERPPDQSPTPDPTTPAVTPTAIPEPSPTGTPPDTTEPEDTIDNSTASSLQNTSIV